MSMTENSKSFVDRKNIKQRNLSESETKYFVRNHDKNAGISIFRARDEGTSVLGEIYNARTTAGAKEKMEASFAMDERQKYNWALSKLLKTDSGRQTGKSGDD